MNHDDNEEEREGGVLGMPPSVGAGIGDDEEGGFGLPIEKEEKEWE